MGPSSGGAAAEQARKEYEEVQDDPDARLRFAERFYVEGHDGRVHKYGTSELAFMEWEARRGVLNPVSDAVTSGSPWWRDVNGGLLVDAGEAFIRHEQGDTESVSQGVAPWVQFLENPTAANWYRAHNTSVALGYLAHGDQARTEDGWEQKLMNIVLYRVLFTQAVVDRQPWALGLLVGRLAGLFDPRSMLVARVVKDRSLYPESYPLDPDDRRRLERRFNHFDNIVVATVDLAFIRARLDRLYAYMADDLDVPELQRFCSDRLPSYPWCIHLHDNELIAIGVTDHPGWPMRALGRVMDALNA
jgi:hypothetical protein